MKNNFTGGDFSHWQNKNDFEKYVKSCEFFAHKLTEGTGFIDRCAYNRVYKYGNSKPCILYHVLTFQDDISLQFNNYKKMWEKCHLACGALGCAIDIESSPNYFPPYLTDVDTLVDKIIFFGQLIKNELKRRPIVYVGDLYDKKLYQSIRDNDWLVWIARYTPKKSNLKNVFDIWQFTDKPFDCDIFNGDVNKLHSVLKDWGD